MSEVQRCGDCFGIGRKVEMTPVKFGQPLPPYRPCPRCDGTGKEPVPKR